MGEGGEVELESIPVSADREPHSHLATRGTVSRPHALKNGKNIRRFDPQSER